MTPPPLIALLRPHQWIKNAFVAAPLFFTPAAVSPATLEATGLGIIAFCLLSSTVYVLNDFLDRKADRQHPTKRNRPLAAGTVSLPLAGGVAAVFLIGGLALSASLGTAFAIAAAAYLINNALYSVWLKHVAIIDVMSITLGFVLRVEAGGFATGVELSAWIVIMTGLLAVFLGLAKRRDDIVKKLGNNHRRSLDGYSRRFLDAALAMVVGALLVAYLIYTTDQQVMGRLGTSKLFYTAPFVAYGLLRYLQITMVHERSGSPTKIALTDWPIIAAIIGWVGTFGLLIYDAG